ncbi:MAG: hypothetical protein EON86_14005 [Brevundimonas sp.]|nr:MAG: hypothetical protein EON86_14005 [Brevundimonas sp.]
MARAFEAAEQVNAVVCPEIDQRATAADQQLGHVSGRQPTGDDAFPRAHLTLERAVVSPDGREAIVYLGEQSAPLAGGGFFILYRQDADGTWREAGRLPIWIS